jgi:hypothetical protein
MASRSHTTQKKRQRELARLEKAQDKAARRVQRKQEERPAGESGPPMGEAEVWDTDFEPELSPGRTA